MSSKRHIFLPVEVLNRDLDARLWLAVLAAKPSNRILVGDPMVLYEIARRATGGLYVGKNLFLTSFPTDLSRYDRLKEQGFSVVHLDDEGAVIGEDSALWGPFLDLRLDAKIVRPDDYICTWGDFQRDHYRAVNPSISDRIRSTGHPRFELYKPAYRRYYAGEAEKLKRRFGRFVLINTNIGHANNGLGLDHTFGRFEPSGLNIHNYNPADPENRRAHFERWDYQMHILSNLVRTVNSLSLRMPETHFVIRPHPAEDWSFYRTIFQGVANVSVLHEGPVAPWLIAADLLIQEGCTTAIEAHLADTPVINYESHDQTRGTQNTFWLPTLFGLRVTTESQVLDATREILAGRNEIARKEVAPVVPTVMENFKSDSLASVVEVMDRAEENLTGSSGPTSFQVYGDEARRRVTSIAKKVVRPLFPWKQQLHEFFARNTFQGLDPETTGEKLRVIESVTGKKVRASFLNRQLMTIEAE